MEALITNVIIGGAILLFLLIVGALVNPPSLESPDNPVGETRPPDSPIGGARPPDGLPRHLVWRDRMIREREMEIERAADRLGLEGEERRNFISFWAREEADAINELIRYGY